MQQNTANQRSLFRIETDTKIKLTPIFSEKLSNKTFETKMINLSGSGCKVRKPKELIDCEKMLVEFELNEETYKIYCGVVRMEDKTIAIRFDCPYVSPEGESPSLKVIKERIIRFVFQNQETRNTLRHFFHKRK